MAYPQFTFSQFLQDYCHLANVGRNTSTGLYEPTVADKAAAAQLLTEACQYAWQDWNPTLLLPSITESATVAPASNVVSWATLEYSSKWSFWTTDPRSSYEEEDGFWREYARRGVQDDDGVRIVDAEDSMVAFYQKAAPEFNHVNLVAATTYAAGDVVWDGTDGIVTTPATGHCYKALGAYAGSAIADTTKWTRQSAPQELRQALRRRVNELRMGDTAGQPERGQQEKFTAEQLLENVFLRHLKTAPPWYLMNGGLF